jgi:hypothetical protein
MRRLLIKLLKRLFIKEKQQVKINNNSRPFDEDEWKDARDFAMYGEAHYSCGDKD